MPIYDFKNLDFDKLLDQLDTALKLNTNSGLELNNIEEKIKAIMNLTHAKMILLYALNNKYLPAQEQGELSASNNIIRDALENDPAVTFFKDEKFWTDHGDQFSAMTPDERREFYRQKNSGFH